jgi:hypothetical protein
VCSQVFMLKLQADWLKDNTYDVSKNKKDTKE